MWCAGTGGCCRTCKHALRVIDGSWPITSAAQGSAAVLFIFLSWDESLLFVSRLSCVLAPVFKLSLIEFFMFCFCLNSVNIDHGLTV